MGKGASLGKEAVLADLGWVGEVAAGASGSRRPSSSGAARMTLSRPAGRGHGGSRMRASHTSGSVEGARGNPSCLPRQLSEGAGDRPTPTARRSTARRSSRLYGLLRQENAAPDKDLAR